MDDVPVYSHSSSSGERRSGERRSSAGAQSSSRGRLTSFGEPTSTGGRLTTGEGLPSRGQSSYPISPSPSQVHRSRTSSSGSWVLPPIEPLRLDNGAKHPPPSFRPFPSYADTQQTDSGSWLHVPMPEPTRPFAMERQISPPRPLPIPSPHPNARGANDLPPSAAPHDPFHFDPPVDPMPVMDSPEQATEEGKAHKRGGFVGGFFRRLPKVIKPRPSEKSIARERSATMGTVGSVSTLPRYTSNPSTPDTNLAGLGAGSRLAARLGQMQSIPEIRVPAALSRAPTPPQDAEPPRTTVVDLSDVPPSLRPGRAGNSASPTGGGVTVSPIRPLSPKQSSGRASASTYKPSTSRPISGRPESGGTRPDSALIFAPPSDSRPPSAHTGPPLGEGSPPDDSHFAVQARLRASRDYSKMGSPQRPGQPLSLSTTEPSFSSQLGNPIQRFFRAVNTMPWVAETVARNYRPPPPKKKLQSWYRQTRANASVAPARRRASGVSTRTRTTIDLLSSRSPSRLSETSAGLSSPSSPHGDRGNYRTSRPRPRTAHRRRHRAPSEVPDVPPLPPGVYAYPYPPYGYPGVQTSPKSASHSTRTSSSHRRSGGHRDEYRHQRRRANDHARFPGGFAPPPPGMFQPTPSGMYHPTPPTPLYVLQSTPAGSQGGMSVSLMTPVYAQMPLAAPAGTPAAGSPNVAADTPQGMPGGMPPPMPVPLTS
ncbi:hypothetical protein HDZ31DRAFT_61607 [Schizophyllum fasciatum]